MKIGIDIRTLTDKYYSGVSEYTLNLVNNLLKIDVENEYFLFYNSFGEVEKNIRNLDYFKDRARIIKTSYPNKIFNYILEKGVGYPKLDRVCGQVDIFFSPHINFSSFSKQIKTFLTIHDLSYLRYPEFFTLRKNFWHRMINVKKLAGEYTGLIAVSENTKKDIVDFLEVDDDRIEVIHSGVDETYEQLDKEVNRRRFGEVRKKYRLPDKFFLVMNNLEPRKNISGIIRAYNGFRDNNGSLADYKFVLAGAPGWRGRSAREEYERSRYKKDIIFTGYIDSEDRVYILNLAQALLYYSFYEGFGFPPLEAFRSGCPVVSSLASSLPEVLNGAAIMVDPYNEAQMSEAIKQIALQPKLRQDLITAGRRRALIFDWRETARKYLRVFSGH